MITHNQKRHLESEIAKLAIRIDTIRRRLERQIIEDEFLDEDGLPLFKGCRDIGYKGKIPENPRTPFEHMLKLQQKNPDAFMMVGGKRHREILEVVRSAHELRTELEENWIEKETNKVREEIEDDDLNT